MIHKGNHVIELPSERRNPGPMLRGFQIRLARLAIGWTQQELADKAQLGVATIQRAEHADVPSVTGSNLFAIQRALEQEGVTFVDDAEASLGGGPGLRYRRRQL